MSEREDMIRNQVGQPLHGHGAGPSLVCAESVSPDWKPSQILSNNQQGLDRVPPSAPERRRQVMPVYTTLEQARGDHFC